MYHPEYSAVLPNGTVTYHGHLELNKGNHAHMPPAPQPICREKMSGAM